MNVPYGPFYELTKASIPLNLLVHLDDKGFHLDDKGLSFGGSEWTTRQSKTGFSIYIFSWNQSKLVRAKVVVPAKKKKKHKKKVVSPLNRKEGSENHQDSGMEVAGSPKDAHQHIAGHPNSKDQSTEYQISEDEGIHMVEYEQVSVEVKQGAVGVQYVRGGEDG